jgi:8-oxo-dGTP diphosphatase
VKYYVTGFLFTKDSKHVVLIKKLNPKWQRGLFNGVGGKIEENEKSCDAMSREFKEETGVVINAEEWVQFSHIHRPGFYHLDLYYAHSDLAFDVRTIEKEEVHIVKVNNLPENIIPNLQWLIPLALDKEMDFSNPILMQEIANERTKS